MDRSRSTGTTLEGEKMTKPTKLKPKKTNNDYIRFRCREDWKKELKKKCALMGVDMTEFIVFCIEEKTGKMGES